MLAQALSDQIGRAVEDRTGLSGVFDFTLDWTPDADPHPNVPDGPSLFTALREQLGFRLEARKGRVPVVVIDHVDTSPTAN